MFFFSRRSQTATGKKEDGEDFMTADRLTAEELTKLVKRVFEPRPEDRALAVIVDLPDDVVPDTERVARAPGAGRRVGEGTDERSLRPRPRDLALSLPKRPFEQRRPAGLRLAMDRRNSP